MSFPSREEAEKSGAAPAFHSRLAFRGFQGDDSLRRHDADSRSKTKTIPLTSCYCKVHFAKKKKIIIIILSIFLF